MTLHEYTVAEAAAGLRTKEFSAVELTQSCLDRIKQTEARLHAFLEVTADSALAAAAAADKRLAGGQETSPLNGIPVAVKDIMATTEGHTTAASKMLADYHSPYDATVVAKLKAAGAVIVGKTNLDEFAHGASTENSAFGPTHNPWDVARVPGGSSGGSAAAVTAGQTIAALGTDTGGSIRYPAGFCGVVGLKPTYGRCSRYGLLSMTSSTDVPGPMTKTVADAAILLQAMAGVDPHDATSLSEPVADYRAALTGEVSDLTIGIPKEFFGAGLTPEVDQLIQAAITTLERLGATIREVSLPHSQQAIAVYYVITPSEISANLARYDGLRFGHHVTDGVNLSDAYNRSRGEGFGPEVKRRIMLGTYALSSGYYDAYYLQAQKVRTVIRRETTTVLADVDLLLAPTAPHVAFPIGQQVDDPLKMYLEDVYMGLASITGLPAISVPAGFANGLPVGLQLIGRPLREDVMLRAADAYQRVTDWHLERPSLTT